jgi:hypothetical protein
MRDRIPFSHLLPLIDLALLVVLIFVPVTLTALRLYQAASGSDHVHLRSGEFDVDLPRDQIIPWAIRAATTPRARIMTAINLPGGLIQKLISLSAHTLLPWHPQALALETWQALIYPFFAMPFWWLVGRGLDGLLYKERLHWSLLVTGAVLFGLCLAALISFCFPMPAADRIDLALYIKSFLAWALGFATLPATWVVQSIRRSREAHGA